MSEELHEIDIQMFVVDERPFACWGVDEFLNLDFIRGIDPAYFIMQADALSPLLETHHQRRAATALRLAFSHALETLFALSFASLQAPNCIQGWLLKYGVDDLLRLTEKINDGRPTLTRRNLAGNDWKSVVSALYAPFEQTELTMFIRWYRWLARDLLNGARRDEYNQVKHGFRARATPTAIMFQAEGIEEPLVWSSEHGTGFSGVVPVMQGNRINFGLQYQRINWTPSHMVQSLRVITALIHNLLSALLFQLVGEQPELWPLSEEMTIEALRTTATHGFNTFNMRSHYNVQLSDMISGDDILAGYTSDST